VPVFYVANYGRAKLNRGSVGKPANGRSKTTMGNAEFANVHVIDSHTGGEPTRVVIDGGPELGGGDMASRRANMKRSADWLRTSLVTEPRGSECMVGAVLQQPLSPAAAAGVIFFNNVGYLGMCGHGLIGLVATLAHLHRIAPGSHLIETPVGDVTVQLDNDGAVSFENVRSYRHLKDVEVDAGQVGRITGDVAWGGNWFFLTNTERRLLLADASELTQITLEIQRALRTQRLTGRDGAEIDHIELVGPPGDPATANARNFVLCPGGQYDRSPCGTGTCAKLACLAADGKVLPGSIWRQESILGSVFEGSFRPTEGGIIPTITGKAFINADVKLVIDPRDPFRFGIKLQDNR
jgi:4-hydroxyproline epimerase